MSKSKKCPSAVLQWEDAGKKLSTSLSAYLQSCVCLGTFTSSRNPNATRLANQIDISLNTLHTRLFDELSQSRTILSQMRNAILAWCYSLPNEVLAEIFKDVVFSPIPGEDRYPSMSDALERIFGRLHSLLAVCSAWRNIGLGLSELWSIIPLGNGRFAHPTPAATFLAIQKSQSFSPPPRHLHLAADLYARSTISSFIEEQVPQFSSISIETQFRAPTYIISDLLGRLSETQSSFDTV